MTKYNEWKIWNGGEWPVPEGAMGQVQSAAQNRIEAEGTGRPYPLIDILGWVHNGDPRTDVIAYRTVARPLIEVDRTKTTFKRADYTLEWTLVNGKVTKVELVK